MKPAAAAEAVLRRYDIQEARLEPISTGLINLTFLVHLQDGGRRVLQRVNRLFPPEVHEDIEAVTTHLASRDMLTPHLVRTSGGALCVQENGEVWRLMTWIDGISRDSIQSAADANGAGRLLGRFHAALTDLQHEFRCRRPVHDTVRHLRFLQETLESRRAHHRFPVVEPLGREILAAASTLAPLPRLPERVVHGDPKINNLLFERTSGEALCLVDLDTIAYMALPLELGDALRSWCNPNGEDIRATEFAPELFKAAMEGYAGSAGALLTPAEWQAIVPATLTICVELAARFCSDALNEDYFSWNPQQFASHSEHSEVRAAGQLALWSAAHELRQELETAVRGFFP